MLHGFPLPFFVCVHCLCLVKGFLCKRVFVVFIRAEPRWKPNSKAALHMPSDTGCAQARENMN